jgi:phosphatidylserine/phosphatidylglycerophosphate/cardiolipin synthase-like enzyme
MHRTRTAVLRLLVLLSAAFGAWRCAAAGPALASASGAPGTLTIVETPPLETTLDHPDVPNAADVWVEMVAAAQETVDIGSFYAVSAPGTRLEEVIAGLQAAGERGVRVRVLVDQRLSRSYGETVERLAAIPGAEVRQSRTERWMGGVLHAKYMVVDGRDAFLGSQNFDWRSLEHVQELGVRLQEPTVIAVLRDVFALDWAMSAGGAAPESAAAPWRATKTYAFPVTVPYGDDTVRVTPALSPTGWLPDESLWDLPRLLERIASARERIVVQVMSYALVAHDGTYGPELDAALRAAAARGVQVDLMVSAWAQRAGQIEALQSLEPLPHLNVKIVTLPEWSGGFIDHARVIHSKFMVVDGTWAWVGSSNWSRDYFHGTRNVGLIVEGAPFARRLQALFQDLWDSPYAAPVDPCRVYEAPRIKE